MGISCSQEGYAHAALAIAANRPGVVPSRLLYDNSQPTQPLEPGFYPVPIQTRWGCRRNAIFCNPGCDSGAMDRSTYWGFLPDMVR